MAIPTHEIGEIMAKTLIWAQRQAGASALIKEIEHHGNEIIGLIVPGDQRVSITIRVEDITGDRLKP